ncbi:hypothetical protein OS42_45880 [Dickeya oryzae]
MLWWKVSLHWNGELQRHTPFRRSDPQQRYWLRLEDESEKTRFMLQDDGPSGWKKIDVIRSVEQAMADGVSLWVEMDYTALYLQLAEEKQWELARVSDRFGEISISTRDNLAWCWHPWLGVFGEKS